MIYDRHVLPGVTFIRNDDDGYRTDVDLAPLHNNVHRVLAGLAHHLFEGPVRGAICETWMWIKENKVCALVPLPPLCLDKGMVALHQPFPSL